jgi:Rieske Fe-S protein
VTIPVLVYLYPKDLAETPAEPVPVCASEDLPVGASKVMQFGRYPALVLNTEDGLKAYSAVCTHFACLVKYNAETGEIDCPCHEGYFDPLDGSVISGPPPRPLDALPVDVAEDGLIYIGGSEGDDTP